MFQTYFRVHFQSNSYWSKVISIQVVQCSYNLGSVTITPKIDSALSPKFQPKTEDMHISKNTLNKCLCVVNFK